MAENAPMVIHPALIPLLSIFLLAGPTIAAAATTITGVARISDGDTISIEETRIRLNGIDAPETDQVCIDGTGETYACGIAARDALAEFLQGQSITCSGDEIDRYDRRIMTCFVGDTDINAAMVAGGWALAFLRYADIYVGEEQAARARQAGLWSGAFIAPWDWRHRGPQTEILGSVSVPRARRRLLGGVALEIDQR